MLPMEFSFEILNNVFTLGPRQRRILNKRAVSMQNGLIPEEIKVGFSKYLKKKRRLEARRSPLKRLFNNTELYSNYNNTSNGNI